MSTRNVIRAWKDPAYRNTLSAAERAALPANPAGSIELSAVELESVAGGRKPIDLPRTLMCPSKYVCTFACSFIVCQA